MSILKLSGSSRNLQTFTSRPAGTVNMVWQSQGLDNDMIYRRNFSQSVAAKKSRNITPPSRALGEISVILSLIRTVLAGYLVVAVSNSLCYL